MKKKNRRISAIMHEGHLNGKCLYMPILGQNLGSIEMKKKGELFFTAIWQILIYNP